MCKKYFLKAKTLVQQHDSRSCLRIPPARGGHRLLPYFLLIVSIITNCQLSRIKSLSRYLIDEISVDVFPEERRELVNLDLRKSTRRDIGTLPRLPCCNTQSHVSYRPEARCSYLPDDKREKERNRDTRRTDSL